MIPFIPVPPHVAAGRALRLGLVLAIALLAAVIAIAGALIERLKRSVRAR